ncbi:MAG TPA: PHB depolymerase family esterase [Gemmatimonadaceae bacterium]|nr:PHB depolymerase family esterase [Gemmatimonadaceae bacterium]
MTRRGSGTERTKRQRRRLGLPAVGIAVSVACSNAAVSPPGRGPSLAWGNHTFSLQHDGRDRSYIVHVPPHASGPLPVLLAFHGGGGNAAGFQAYADLDRVADASGFLVVYPNGTGLLQGVLLTFNSGDGCCGYARSQNVDDVGFALAVLADLETRTRIDRRRIYATGHSNGAGMSHRLAAEQPHVVAAIAPVAASLDLAVFAPPLAVPVLQIHSVDDPRALYDGGLGPPFPGTNHQAFHQPVQAGLDRWIAVNGCPTTPVTVEIRTGAAGSDDEGHTASHLVWGPCTSGAEVRHWKLTGAGHGWPGNIAPSTPESLIGPHTSIVIAAEEVWAFVSRFSR